MLCQLHVMPDNIKLLKPYPGYDRTFKIIKSFQVIILFTAVIGRHLREVKFSEQSMIVFCRSVKMFWKLIVKWYGLSYAWQAAKTSTFVHITVPMSVRKLA